jgi:ribosomal protein S18 acetylase RimI-like enzyme
MVAYFSGCHELEFAGVITPVHEAKSGFILNSYVGNEAGLDDALLQSVAKTFCAVFQHSRWAETHDVEDARRYLDQDLHQPDTLPMLITARKDEELVGFFWGYQAPFQVLFPLMLESLTEKYPQYLQGEFNPELVLEQSLETLTLAGMADSLFYVSEFGIMPEYRKTSMTTELLMYLCSECIGLGWLYHIGWTNREKSGIYPWLMKSGSTDVYDFGSNTIIVAGEFEKLNEYVISTTSN